MLVNSVGAPQGFVAFTSWVTERCVFLHVKVSHWILYAWAGWLVLLLTLMTLFCVKKATFNNYAFSAVFKYWVVLNLILFWKGQCRSMHISERVNALLDCSQKVSLHLLPLKAIIKKKRKWKNPGDQFDLRLQKKKWNRRSTGISTSRPQLKFSYSNGILEP